MQLLTREVIRENTVITLELQSLDASNSREVAKSLAEAMRGERRVVLDLGSLGYFDVNGFATILQWAAGHEGQHVRVCSQSGTIHSLFELLGANTLLPLFQTREEAIASFERPGQSDRQGFTDTLAS